MTNIHQEEFLHDIENFKTYQTFWFSVRWAKSEMKPKRQIKCQNVKCEQISKLGRSTVDWNSKVLCWYPYHRTQNSWVILTKVLCPIKNFLFEAEKEDGLVTFVCLTSWTVLNDRKSGFYYVAIFTLRLFSVSFDISYLVSSTFFEISF